MNNGSSNCNLQAANCSENVNCYFVPFVERETEIEVGSEVSTAVGMKNVVF
jgi:hypothetical protein